MLWLLPWHIRLIHFSIQTSSGFISVKHSIAISLHYFYDILYKSTCAVEYDLLIFTHKRYAQYNEYLWIYMCTQSSPQNGRIFNLLTRAQSVCGQLIYSNTKISVTQILTFHE